MYNKNFLKFYLNRNLFEKQIVKLKFKLKKFIFINYVK